MDNSVPRLIRESNKKIRTLVEETFRENGLDDVRPQEGRMLWYIVEHPGTTSADICQHQCLAKSSVSESLAVLADKGFIEYLVNAENRREKVIVVTPLGALRQKKVDKAFDSISEKLLDGLSQKEVEALQGGLRKIIENAERRD